MTGVELIAKERQEQIEKHKWNDTDYISGELVQAALFCMKPTVYVWPKGWSKYFKQKIEDKCALDQLVIAGAFIAAEIDRIQSDNKESHV